MSQAPVVPETRTLDEQSFHDRLVAGWSRAIASLTKPVFAHRIGMTTRGLEKVLAGSTPHACTIFNSRAAEPTALDEVLAGYGLRLVPADSACSSDEHAGLALLRAAHKCVEAEADGVKDHQELLAMEPELRASASIVANMLARIDALKGC